MAQVKFFKFDTDGYQVEHDIVNDDLTIGSLTLDAGGAGIDMNLTKVTDMADGTAATDAVTKQQLDAVSAGADLKEECRVATAAALPANTAAGSGVGKTLTANANGSINTVGIDGVTTLALADRVLVKDETAGADVDHGIYTITDLGSAGTPWVLTRATDADEDAEVTQGLFTFIVEGTANANTGWAISTADPITVDTTAIEFNQRQGLPDFTWAAGLVATGSSIAVDLDTAADAQGVGSGGGTSGLEFDAAGDAGQLRVKVDPAGGVQRGASGISLELDGTTLSLAAAGLSVAGLPSLFEINGVATGASVTAANLDTLTDGSNADALHVHAGADEAQRVETVYTSDGTGVTKGDAVYVSANDVVSEINANNNNTRKFIGLAKTTVGATTSVDVVSAGLLTGVTVAGAPSAGDLVYAAVGGGLTVTLPTGSGNHRLVVGKMKNATDVQISPQYLGKIA